MDSTSLFIGFDSMIIKSKRPVNHEFNLRKQGSLLARQGTERRFLFHLLFSSTLAGFSVDKDIRILVGILILLISENTCANNDFLGFYVYYVCKECFESAEGEIR
jgi:hypothetical protein